MRRLPHRSDRLPTGASPPGWRLRRRQYIRRKAEICNANGAAQQLVAADEAADPNADEKSSIGADTVQFGGVVLVLHRRRALARIGCDQRFHALDAFSGKSPDSRKITCDP